MSNVDQPINPVSHPDQFEFFAFVVDGEAAVIIPVKSDAELLIAAWSSEPKVVKLKPEQKNVVQQGDLLGYDNTFTKPNPPDHIGNYTGIGTMEPSDGEK